MVRLNNIIISCLLVIVSPSLILAQEANLAKDTTGKRMVKVENAVWGIQLGSVGIWGHGEFGFLDRFALRAEAGFGGNIGVSQSAASVMGAPFITFPIIVTLEQRWYYHLSTESYLSKNSGSFVAVKAYGVLPWSLLSYYSDEPIGQQVKFGAWTTPAIAFMAKWGVRYTWGEHFTLEAGAGAGWIGAFSSSDKGLVSGLAIDIHLRIGYTF